MLNQFPKVLVWPYKLNGGSCRETILCNYCGTLTLHRNSLTWRLVCSSGNRWLCTDLSITSRFPRMTASVTRLVVYRLEHGWPAPKTVSPPNSFHQREIQFYLLQQNSSTDYCRVCDHHKWFFKPSLSPTVTRTTIYADMTLVMFQLFRFLEIFICNTSKAR